MFEKALEGLGGRNSAECPGLDLFDNVTLSPMPFNPLSRSLECLASHLAASASSLSLFSIISHPPCPKLPKSLQVPLNEYIKIQRKSRLCDKDLPADVLQYFV